MNDTLCLPEVMKTRLNEWSGVPCGSTCQCVHCCALYKWFETCVLVRVDCVCVWICVGILFWAGISVDDSCLTTHPL
eukprot:m.64701 g.64701  ORF g.64701 m.64701 type:complete len:77 (+) comp12023_c0_seq2:1134-1364(+)